MRQAIFTGVVKKIQVVNTIAKSDNADDKQSLQVLIGDVAITDMEFLELRRFRPADVVNVTVTSRQLEMLLGHLKPKEDTGQQELFADGDGLTATAGDQEPDGDTEATEEADVVEEVTGETEETEENSELYEADPLGTQEEEEPWEEERASA